MNNEKINILFFGTPDIAATILTGLISDEKYKVIGVVTNPDRPAGRGKKINQSPVKIIASENNLPVFQADSLKKNRDSFFDWLKQFTDITVGIVVAYGQILTSEVLNYPKHGCINLHASLLPRWRGAAPINRAIIAGDTQTGIGLMKMETGLDTGDVYCQSTLPINDNDIASEIHDKLATLGSKLLNEKLIQIILGSINAKPQVQSSDDEQKITYAEKIKNEELKINWNKPANELIRFIHGMAYHPGAFSFYPQSKDQLLRIKFFRAQTGAPLSSDHQFYNQPPGTIIQAFDSILRIKAGHQETILILEAQVEGKKRLKVHEFLSGGTFNSGQILS